MLFYIFIFYLYLSFDLVYYCNLLSLDWLTTSCGSTIFLVPTYQDALQKIFAQYNFLCFNQYKIIKPSVYLLMVYLVILLFILYNKYIKNILFFGHNREELECWWILELKILP
jgi:hypothetical protein